MKDSKQQKTELVPEEIFKFSQDYLGFFPSVIETDYYVLDGLVQILKGNKIIWSEKYFNGINTIYKKGLISLESNKILIFFKKREDENSYKFYCLLQEDSTDSIVFYFNKLKEYKTIT